MSFGNFINNAGNIQKNVTIGNLTLYHEAIVNKCNGIKSASFGDIFNVDVAQATLYPLAHLSVESATYSNNELTYNMRLYIMDLVDKDAVTENFVLSDTMQLVGDYISLLKHGQMYYQNLLKYDSQSDFRVSDNITCEPFTERYDASVTGWASNFSITVSFNASACDGDIM
jgi:hypothetical protein